MRSLAMRPLAVLAAITFMNMAHAIPRPDLAIRDGVNDLSNDRHVFHHLDRNQRTANRDRDRVSVMREDNGEGSESYAIKRLAGKLQRAGWRKMESVVERRFMQDPDYSQGGTDPSSQGSDTMPKSKGGHSGEAVDSHGA